MCNGCGSSRQDVKQHRSVHPNGNPWEIWHEDSSGFKHGTAYTFYENGNRMTECMFERGYLNGAFMMWDRNGNTMANGRYRNGEPWDGTFISTANNGGRVEFHRYQNGKLIHEELIPSYE